MTSGLSKYRSFASEFKPRSLELSGGRREESVVKIKGVEAGMSGSLSPAHKKRRRVFQSDKDVKKGAKSAQATCTRTFTSYAINDELICVAVPKPGPSSTRSSGQDAFLTRLSGRRTRC